MKRMLFMVVGFSACFAASAYSWNKPGHMATGAIAYHVLKKSSPKTIPKVVELLKQHVSYGEKWKKLIDDLDEDADADEFLFMYACRWADDVRGQERFYPEGSHKDAIHYINQPFLPAGQPKGTKTNKEFEINIVRAFPDIVKTLKEDADGPTRAVSLTWVMHLVGDAHQPLHTVSLYTENFQFKDHGRLVGDRGGTWFYVRKSATTKTAYSLHSIWDEFLTSKDKYRDNRKVALKMISDPEHASDNLTEGVDVIDVEKWVAESFQIARTKAYFHEGTLLRGTKTKTQAEALPDGYLSAMAPIARRRGVLAGYRMAAVLRDAVGD